MARVGNILYLLGGRGNLDVERYDGGWSSTSAQTDDLHHFQAVSYGDRIWMPGVMEGGFPNEQPVARMMVFDPATGDLETVGEPLGERARGSAGAAAYCDRIYLVGGVTEGHSSAGTVVAGFDVYDPATGQWSQAGADMPHPRDHFHAIVVGHRLYALGGRETNEDSPGFFDNLVPEVDVYDFELDRWLTDGEAPPDLPTPRAGAAVVALGDAIFVIGGESGQADAFETVERLSTRTYEWSSIPASLPGGRHGSQAVACGGAIYLAGGSTTQGAAGETNEFNVYLPTADTPGC